MKYFVFFVFLSLFGMEFTPNLAIADTSSEHTQSEVEFQKAISALKAGDRDLAVSVLTKLAEQAHVEAQYELATIYFKERGGPEGKGKEAYRWYRLAAEKGHAKAQHKLGLIASVGMFGLKSTEVAIKWYDKAAKQGLVEAQHDLGVFYVKYFTRNYVHSYAWLLIASLNGHPAAENKLKVLEPRMAPHQLLEAEGLAENFVSTNVWTDPPAGLLSWQVESGIAMFRQKEYKTAFSILYPHAQEGYPHAQFIIGFFYESGLGAPQNYQEAYKWYKKAAYRGDPEGQYFLGRSYYTGKGVQQNYEEAYKWIAISKENGKKNIQENINVVLENLLPKKKQEIDIEVSEWLTAHPKYTSTRQPKGPSRPKF
ncbi:MAG: tetratricopeptide repeat protein [Halopseudomonas aestusnigri]